MKLTKRLIVTLLVGCMMMTMSLPAFAAAPAEDESDICAQEDEMVTFEAYSAAIEAVYAEYGLEGGVYEPDNFSCTKTQLAEDILAVRAHAEQIIARETAPPAQITIDCEGTVATRAMYITKTLTNSHFHLDTSNKLFPISFTIETTVTFTIDAQNAAIVSASTPSLELTNGLGVDDWIEYVSHTISIDQTKKRASMSITCKLKEVITIGATTSWSKFNHTYSTTFKNLV